MQSNFEQLGASSALTVDKQADALPNRDLRYLPSTSYVIYNGYGESLLNYNMHPW